MQVKQPVMRHLPKIASLFSCLFISLALLAQDPSYNVFVPIGKYLAQGNVDNLSAWFSDNLEISLLSSSNNSSKSQAKQILKSFFDSHTPRSFEISHTAGKSNMKYALGTLVAGGERYIVTIFVNYEDETYKIQQIKIDRIQ